MPICKSEDLLRGDRLLIRHGEETYILRLTKSGKLLLTK
ncbi:MAG TPA: hemin uptake protein HemP [bacterium]|nr:hemin uptake protein HemP [bacterium]HXC64019.1 hemin uptake protein HemP [bacterium]